MPFDLTHEDGLLFDEAPELFVDLQSTPIVFTIRGLRYFGVRFRHIGISLAQLKSRSDFDEAFRKWQEVEYSLLARSVAHQASEEHVPGPHGILQAIMNGQLDEAELLIARLERRQATALRIVAGDTREHGRETDRTSPPAQGGL